MQTPLTGLYKQISIPHPWNVKGHGSFGRLENLFHLSVTLQIWQSVLYARLSKTCICRVPHSVVSPFKFTKTSRTAAWPGSPRHEKQNSPYYSAKSLENISPSHGCKLIRQQCFEVALDRFVFAWAGWDFVRLMSSMHADDQGRLSLHIRGVLYPISDLK